MPDHVGRGWWNNKQQTSICKLRYYDLWGTKTLEHQFQVLSLLKLRGTLMPCQQNNSIKYHQCVCPARYIMLMLLLLRHSAEAASGTPRCNSEAGPAVWSYSSCWEAKGGGETCPRIPCKECIKQVGSVSFWSVNTCVSYHDYYPAGCFVLSAFIHEYRCTGLSLNVCTQNDTGTTEQITDPWG